MAIRHLNRGVSFIEKRLHADATQALEQAEKDAREADSPEILANVLQTYADLLLSEGREEDAFERYTEAGEIIVELSGKGYETTEQLASIFSNIAPILEKKGYISRAREKYEVAVNNYEKLIEREKNNIAYRSNAASTLNNLGALLAEEGEYEASKESFQEALNIMEDSPADVKESIPFQFKMATVLGNLLDLETDTGQFKQTEDKYRQLIETYRKIIRMDPLETSYLERLSLALITYGDRMALEGKKEDSGEAYKEALDILEELPDKKENGNEYYLRIVTVLNKRASYFAEKEYHESAKNNLIKALELLEELLENDPSNTDIRSRTVAVLSDLNNLAEGEEASEAKIACYGVIERLSEKLLDINPSSLPYRLNVAFSHNIKGKILAELDRENEAGSEFTKAVDSALEGLQSDMEDTYCHTTSSLINDLEIFAARIKDSEERLRIYGIVLNRLEGFADMCPEDRTIKADIAGVLQKIAKIMIEKENYDDAEFVLGETAAIYDKLLSIKSGDENYSAELSSVLLSLGDLQSELKNQEAALGTYLRLFRMAPANKKYGSKLDSILAETEASPQYAENKEVLIAEYEKLLAIREELLESEPDNTQYSRNLAGLRERIAGLLLDIGRSEEGLDILCSLLSTRDSSSYLVSKVIDALEKFRLSVSESDNTHEKISNYGLLLETYTKLSDMGLADVSVQEKRAEILEKLALLHYENGSLEKAKTNYGYALSAYTKLHSAQPSDIAVLVKTGNLKCRLASLLTDAGHTVDAQQMLRSSLDDYQGLLEHEPSNISYQQNTAYILNSLGYLLLEEKLFKEAKPLYENALKMYVQIIDSDPENMSYKANAACTLNNLGYILENIGRENDAIWMYEKARELNNDHS
ncbi:tetratricopeptide repeat protein [Methanolobus halotolerans]|nr:tetratricopeptide repeat protein [Methanolobus halotolerans]